MFRSLLKDKQTGIKHNASAGQSGIKKTKETNRWVLNIWKQFTNSRRQPAEWEGFVVKVCPQAETSIHTCLWEIYLLVTITGEKCDTKFLALQYTN